MYLTGFTGRRLPSWQHFTEPLRSQIGRKGTTFPWNDQRFRFVFSFLRLFFLFLPHQAHIQCQSNGLFIEMLTYENQFLHTIAIGVVPVPIEVGVLGAELP